MAEFTAPTGIDALEAIAAGKAAGLRGHHPGWTPAANYRPRNRGPEIVAHVWVSGGIAVVMVLLRMVARRKGLWLEDWLMLPAIVAAVGYMIEMTFAARKGGLGKHDWDSTYEELRIGLITQYFNMICYIISITIIKFSILAFLYRISSPLSSRRTILFLHFCLGLHVVLSVTTFFVYLFPCLPIQANISLSLRFHPDTRCKNYEIVYYLFAGAHSLSDFLILFSPVSIISRLRMAMKRKLGVMVMFLVGGFACFCSLLRIAFIPHYTSSLDIGWDSIEPVLCGLWEVNLAIISSSLPALHSLWVGPGADGPGEIAWGPGSRRKRIRHNVRINELEYQVELALAGREEGEEEKKLNVVDVKQYAGA